MEDPETFDVWLRFAAEHADSVKRLLSASQPELPRLALLQRVARGRLGSPTLIASDVGWAEACRWATEASTAGTTTLYQSGYGTLDDGRLHVCGVHALRHAGVLGCPVCGRRHRP
jgi:hypothetical protein